MERGVSQAVWQTLKVTAEYLEDVEEVLELNDIYLSSRTLQRCIQVSQRDLVRRWNVNNKFSFSAGSFHHVVRHSGVRGQKRHSVRS